MKKFIILFITIITLTSIYFFIIKNNIETEPDENSELVTIRGVVVNHPEKCYSEDLTPEGYCRLSVNNTMISLEYKDYVGENVEVKGYLAKPSECFPPGGQCIISPTIKIESIKIIK